MIDPAPTPSGADPTFAVPLPDIGILGFDGPDAAAFLQGQLSSDVAALEVGAAQWSSYNSPKGRMLANFLLWRAAPDSFRAWLAADLAQAVRKRLAMFVLRAKVEVTDRTADGPRIGLVGPGAEAAVATALGVAPASAAAIAGAGVIAVGAPDGRWLVQPAATAGAVGARLAALTATGPTTLWHLAGIRAGVPLVTAATTDQFVPQTANWDLVGGVNFKKGCYPGQEIVARMQYLGRLKERLARFHCDGAPPAAGARLFAPATFGDQPCGTVVNAEPASAGGSEFLAVVQWSALTSDALRLGAVDGPRLARAPLPYAVPVPDAPARPQLG